jgi:hypothetical protein
LGTMSRSDLRMLARATRERWNIPASVMEEIPNAMMAIVNHSDCERSKVSAAKVVIEIVKHNQEMDDLDNHPPEIIEITAENLEQHRAELLRCLEEADTDGNDSGADGGGETSTE